MYSYVTQHGVLYMIQNDKYTMCIVLWLLRLLRNKLTTMSIVQMLERPAIQVEMLLNDMQESGLVCQLPETHCWGCTDEGLKLLGRDYNIISTKKGGILHAQLAACEGNGSIDDCEASIKQMYDLLKQDRLPGVAGYLELVLNHLGQLRLEPMDTDTANRFVRSVFFARDISLMLMKNIAESTQLMKKAIACTESRGNMRTRVLLELAMATSVFLSGITNFGETLHKFDHALALLRPVQDDELATRAASFMLYLHFIKGRFQSVLDCYELIHKDSSKPLLPCLRKQLVLVASSSAAYMGHFSHARGMLMSAINTADLTDGPFYSRLYRQHLGILLVYMGKDEEGMRILQEVTAQSTMSSSPKQMLRSYAGMAYCLAGRGDITGAYTTLSNALEQAHRQASFSFSINYPWVLELAIKFSNQGFPPLRGFEIDALLLKMQDSPSKMLKGGAFAHMALNALHQGDAEQALQLVSSSLKLLHQVDAPVERARALLVLGKVLQHMGEVDKATENINEANKILRQYGMHQKETPVMPDMGETERTGDPPLVDERKSQILDSCFQKLTAMPEYATLEEYTHELALVFRELLGAGRTAIFQHRGGGVFCLGACNLSSHERGSQSFVDSKALVERHILRSEPLITSQALADVVCVPLTPKSGSHWLLYADSATSQSPINTVGKETLRSLGLAIAAELRNAMRLLDAKAASGEARQLQAVAAMEQENRPVLWGKSKAFQNCLKRVHMVATTDASVLLLGETGVGKEILANYIHKRSACSGPFVAIHPASVSEALFESELFGHEKGAFTGAIRQKLGLLELANKGTLFIDEVGDVPLSMQTKLLRVLQEHTFMRVGGIREIRSSFRLMAATHKDLSKAVQEGTFREDLYYRISVVPLIIPPLRERIDDLKDLVTSFIDYYSRRYGKPVPQPGEDALERMRAYSWPGNLRELKNVVERAVILHTDGPLDLVSNSTIPMKSCTMSAPETLYADTPTLQELQKRYIRHVLKLTGGRVCGPSGAEHLLGMKRSTLYLKLRQFGIT